MTALMYASSSNETDKVEFLLAHGAEIHHSNHFVVIRFPPAPAVQLSH
jgi:ankyrin repeat protein